MSYEYTLPVPDTSKPFDFRHKFKGGRMWVDGPWLVEGPDFSMTLQNRTETVILVNKLNERERLKTASP